MLLHEIIDSFQTDVSIKSLIPIANVRIDSREVIPGDIFLAIRGNNYDGHDFIEEAVTRGAIAVFSQDKSYTSKVPNIVVENTLNALIKIAKKYRSNFSGKVIAITGSTGKTTVKNLVGEIISREHKVLTSYGNQNNILGVALTLTAIKKEHQFLVTELGANHVGEIALLSKIVQPHISMITNISAAHIGEFGGIENTIDAKSEIFLGTLDGGCGVINSKHFDISEKLFQHADHLIKLSFGFEKADSISCTREISTNKYGTYFTLIDRKANRYLPIEMKLQGKHNVENALAAYSLCSNYVSEEAIIESIKSFSGTKRRLQHIETKSGMLVVDDSYNASPAAVTASLEYLATLEGRKAFIFGDMKELGNLSHKYHMEAGATAEKLGISILVTYGQDSLIAAKAFSGKKYHFESKDKLISSAKMLLQGCSVVLIKGSSVMHMDEVTKALVKHFNYSPS